MQSSFCPNYPDRLLINGRLPDTEFDDNERLYTRFATVDPQTGKPTGTDIIPPNHSVNRGKYSEPADVLLADYPKNMNQGYGYVSVQGIPKDMLTGDEVRFDTYPVHDPVAPPKVALENYSHSELRIQAADGKTSIPNRRIKRLFKEMLADKIVVLQLPTLIEANSTE